MKQFTLGILALLVFLAGCGMEQQQEQREGDRTAVVVQEIQPSTFKHYLNIQGTVESDKTIMITPKTNATVESIRVKAGERVEAGDVLAELDGEVTRSQIDELKAQLELAETIYERQKNLREEDIGSEIEFLEAQTQVQSLRSQLTTLREQYDNYTIRATIGGTVDRVSIKEGENVGPTNPAFQVANSEALKVTGEISEAYINRVEQTDSVTVNLPSIEAELTKTIDVVARAINPSNRTFGVEVYIPNINEQVRPNMLAKLRINDLTREEVIVIPINSIQNANGTEYVFIAEETDDGWVASETEIVTGESYNDEIIVEEGLQPGDRLITVGYNSVGDGDPVAIEEN